MSYFGLTGGIACGKSTVAAYFRELGARIIDADRIGHELLQPELPAYREVVEAFGKGILGRSGVIDRRRLGAIAFAGPEKLRRLNAILHPRIIERVEDLAASAQKADPHSVVIVDAALIFEAGIGGRFSKVVVVWCRPEQQIERCMAKTGLDYAEADQRVRSQISAEEKRRRADFVIDCSGSLEETRRQVEELYPKLKRLAAEE